MEQLVPIANLSEDYIEGQDPASLARRFAIVMAARAVANPAAMLLDFQIAGGAGGSNYRVGMPSSPVANPGSILCSRAQVVFGFAQAAAALNTRVANMIADLLAAHPAAVVRFIQFGSANGDGEHLIGIVWEDGQGPDGFLGLRITRVWNVPSFPAIDIVAVANTLTLIQPVTIPCTAQQLGRNYLVWWYLYAEGAEGIPLVGLQGHTRVTTAGGAVQTLSASNLRDDVFATGANNTWNAGKEFHHAARPGINCAPFAVGNNEISFWGVLGANAWTAIAQRSSAHIIELAGDVANLITTVPGYTPP